MRHSPGKEQDAGPVFPPKRQHSQKTDLVSAQAPGQLAGREGVAPEEQGVGTESMIIWMIQAELEFILCYINWVLLVPTCITGFGEYGALFLFLSQQLIVVFGGFR